MFPKDLTGLLKAIFYYASILSSKSFFQYQIYWRYIHHKHDDDQGKKRDFMALKNPAAEEWKPGFGI